MIGRLVARSDLAPLDVDAMQNLLAKHFAGVTTEQFLADLEEKNWVVLIENGKELVGFSTLKVGRVNIGSEPLVVVYSGDTIVSPDAWGSAVFPRAWINAVYALRVQYPTGRLIWLLLTSGYRTYRFLPVFWQTFYPRACYSTPAYWQDLLNTLAIQHFGQRFDPATGIVRLQHPQQLRGRLAEVPPARSVDSDVAFFLARNPGHLHGDELVCVADLDPSQLTRAGRRVVYGSAR